MGADYVMAFGQYCRRECWLVPQRDDLKFFHLALSSIVDSEDFAIANLRAHLLAQPRPVPCDEDAAAAAIDALCRRAGIIRAYLEDAG